jgi:hypothetical protein
MIIRTSATGPTPHRARRANANAHTENSLETCDCSGRVTALGVCADATQRCYKLGAVNTRWTWLPARILAALIVVAFVGVLHTPRASASVIGCGSVIPPIPPGQHEEFTFFKVDASDVSCRVAMEVARREVTLVNTHGFRPYKIDGFECRFVSPPASGPTVRCQRGKQAVLGYNGGV